MKSPFDIESTRSLIVAAFPDTEQTTAQTKLAPGFTYVPQSHALALDPEVPIVEGIRGAGKSFWWATLCSENHRNFLTVAFKELGEFERITITQGYGTDSDGSFPSKDTIDQLMKDNQPRHIWRAVVGTSIGLSSPFPDPSSTWEKRVQWVHRNPEVYDKIVKEKDRELSQARKRSLILFDALDRLGDDWASIRPIAKALFQVALEIRSYANIRIKLFVRPDMVEDDEITSFPDASKLISKKLSLSWRRADLYGLLFQRLGNVQEKSKIFRDRCRSVYEMEYRPVGDKGQMVIPMELRDDEENQKKLFHALTGPTMARGESGYKRGFPYSWLPNHLMDSKGQVSPRSFSAALKEASSASPEKDWPYPLNFRGIQTGVKKASEIRMNEIVGEDYPWVSRLMTPLKKSQLVVPCGVKEIIDIWEKDGTIASLIKKSASQEAIKLPPRHIADGPKGVIEDLVMLGFMEYLLDERIQMPDVYRIAFGIGRKGGVKPLR